MNSIHGFLKPNVLSIGHCQLLTGFYMELNNYSRRSERQSSMLANGIGKSAAVDDDFDPWTAWAYKPRTISLLLIGACLLIWASGVLNSESFSSVKGGVWAMIAVYLAYSLLQAPSTTRERVQDPHKATSCTLTPSSRDGRYLSQCSYFPAFSDLGTELPERSYGADCCIYIPENPTSRFKNVYDTLLDEFVLAHIFGWWGKAIMIRNQPLLWVLSVGFDLHFDTLPNFNECWWDSIILDILICNWFGIWAGMRTVWYFDGKTYEWVGISQQPSVMGKVKRTLGQFTPAQRDKDEWHPLLGPWRFLQEDGEEGRSFVWLSLAICIVELLICIKFGHGMYPEPMPWWLAIFWSSAGAALVLYLTVWSFRLRKAMERKRK
ncbi:hypothetical protein MLD38_003901 [Melastoma candidum]|uniref:Uncharacterized protein n=1 Tax=Melastoma candidum TaxID=119954 RepID=A0ACB9S5I8_9MYRT|nr:hypothetical protein MLD38_003901 [Melastoma candidum]